MVESIAAYGLVSVGDDFIHASTEHLVVFEPAQTGLRQTEVVEILRQSLLHNAIVDGVVVRGPIVLEERKACIMAELRGERQVFARSLRLRRVCLL